MVFCALSLITSHVSASQVDPTKPFGHSASSIAFDNDKMVLESVIHVNDTYIVIISGKILKISDYIGEYQLTEADKKSVVLNSKTEQIKLTILKSDIVKTSVSK